MIRCDFRARGAARALRASLFLGLFLGFPPHAPTRAADGMVDQGTFTVTSAGRVVGTEEFALEARGDTIMGYSKVQQFHGTAGEVETLVKRAGFVMRALDYALIFYKSGHEIRGKTLQRWIQIHDTTFTSYRQVGMQGSGTAFQLPPGKLFVLDPYIYTNFAILCLNLKGRAVQSRPVTMIVLDPDRDSVITATANDLGQVPFRWGGRPLQARHLTLGDAGITFDLWTGPDGKLLRIEHRPSQLRVDRVAPPLKARQPAPKPRG
jgi:hypothetical protein